MAIMFRRRPQEPALPTAPDLLAEAEEAEFVPVVPRPPAPEKPAAEVEWEENEDVYRPLESNVLRFVETLESETPIAISPGAVCVCVRRSALARMRTHLAGDTSIELGGLLVGRVCADSAKATHVTLIERALPASDGAGTATTFSYTAQSWSHLAPELQHLPADMTVVGSYHSHPDMGVFLSSTDLGTQEDVFPQPWQVAIVIDPVRDEVGVFAGPRGKPCDAWYVVAD
jgi:proteasome lid subunit RPN8/RPN11